MANIATKVFFTVTSVLDRFKYTIGQGSITFTRLTIKKRGGRRRAPARPPLAGYLPISTSPVSVTSRTGNSKTRLKMFSTPLARDLTGTAVTCGFSIGPLASK